MERIYRIQKTCALAWDQLTGTGPVRSCAHCVKWVQDRTQSSQKDIDRAFRRHRGQLCLRYFAPRPKRTFRVRRVLRKPSRPSSWLGLWLRRAAALGVLSSIPALTQQPMRTPTQQENLEAQSVGIFVTRTIGSGESLPGVMVTFEGSAVEGTLTSVSNADGEIVMRLPYGEYLVTAMMPGMQTIKERVQIAATTTHHTFNFQLADDEEVFVVGMVGASDGSLEVLFDGVPDDAIDDVAFSGVFDAISERDFDTTRELLNEGVDPNGRGPGGLSPMMMAAYYCDYDIHGDMSDDSQATIDALVATGAQVNASTHRGVSVLTFTVYAAPPDLVRQLICLGADISASDHRGRTAVMMAARSGRTEVLKLLLEADPDLQARDDQGWTALTYALHFGHGQIVEELLDQGARWRGRDHAGLTALHHAAQSNLVDICQRLISEGANLEERDIQGRTPFLMAAEYHQMECLKLLLERGASMWTRDDHGRNALDLAQHDFEGPVDTAALQWLKAQIP